MKSGCSIATGRSIPVEMGCRFFVRSASITISSRSRGRSSSRSLSPATWARTRVFALLYLACGVDSLAGAEPARMGGRVLARVLLQRRNDRHRRLRQYRAEQFPGAHRDDVRVACRLVDVRARDRNSVLALLASDRGADVQLESGGRTVSESSGVHVPRDERAEQSARRARGQSAVLAHRGSASQVRSAHARAESRHVLSAELDGRAPDRRKKPDGRDDGNRLHGEGRRGDDPADGNRRNVLDGRARTFVVQAGRDHVRPQIRQPVQSDRRFGRRQHRRPKVERDRSGGGGGLGPRPPRGTTPGISPGMRRQRKNRAPSARSMQRG